MLNQSKGNMYEFITHTFNTVKGECPHNCSYCYMKRWGKLNPIRFDSKELKTNLGKGNFIFVGSSCDLFSNNIHNEWIMDTLRHREKYPENKYFFQSKNPERFMNFIDIVNKSSFCCTIETNHQYPEIMQNSPKICERVFWSREISDIIPVYITIEPILDFDVDVFAAMLSLIKPIQINIGSDSGNNKLPEPSKDKILSLISELEKFTIVHKKKNLQRLLK